jgi:hypothetical protein
MLVGHHQHGASPTAPPPLDPASPHLPECQRSPGVKHRGQAIGKLPQEDRPVSWADMAFFCELPPSERARTRTEA